MLQHLAIIMDGNRRWAKKHGLPKLRGHERGYRKMKEVAEWCIAHNIKILTVYAFSTENWNRHPSEVNYLMKLLSRAFSEDAEEMNGNGIRIRVIGQRRRLPVDLQKKVGEVEAKTKANKKLLLQIAISYGGRQEIVEAVRAMAKKNMKLEQLTEGQLSRNLWTAGAPDPDVIVRTSGEQRLSNFMSWQSAYSELVFVPRHWPEFSKKDFEAVLSEYAKRHRRYGA